MTALDEMTEPLDYAMSVVRHLESVATYPELRAAVRAVGAFRDLSEAGLSKALAFLRALHREAQPRGGTYRILQQANITRPGPKVSEETREKARAVLKRAGIIG